MAKGKILKIPARGEWSFADADVDADGVFPLETLQGAVGGWIECVWLGEAGFPDLDMFVNEEGKLHGLSFNVVASALSAIFARGDCIVGDLEPMEYLAGYEENEQLKSDWDRILSFQPKRVFYGHAPEKVYGVNV